MNHIRVQRNQVFAAFNFIYTHLMKWPSLSSAAADLELLLKTCQHVASEMKGNSPTGRDISTLLATMYNAALTSVSQAQSFLVLDQQSPQSIHSLLPLSPDFIHQQQGREAAIEPDPGLMTFDSSAWNLEPNVKYDLDAGSWTTPF
jgi:hypothetical protein